MRRLASILGATLIVVSLRPGAQTPATQPIFRGGTDLVQVDVSVLDGKRRPVRGLTAADFTVLEDGQPREIQAFTEVYLPDRVRAEAAPWVRDVSSDVASNQVAENEGRLVVILLDRTIPVGEATVLAKRIAVTTVNQLGPDDLAAVVSTSGGATQNLTSDRARLVRAINESDVSTGMSAEATGIMNLLVPLNPLSDGRCLCGLCVLETITGVADAVQDVPRRRKALFFIGSDLILQSVGSVAGAGADVGCETRLKDARNAMFAAVDRANLTVHALDPSGLATVPIAQASARAGSRNTTETLQRQGALRVLPERTGGRTVTSANAPDVAVSDIFRESDSYYLVGFRPAEREANGKFHQIAVKVNRRGLDVHARSGYTAAPAPEPTLASPTGNPLPEPLQAALSGLLPSASLPVDMNAATFATPGSDKGVVVLAVGVGAFASSPIAAGARQGGPLEVVASAFDRGGRSVGTARQTLELSWPASAPAGDQRFDVLSRLDLPPGQYEIRVGVSGANPARTASVFSYVTVPAFAATPLSLSSIIIGATAGTLTAPKDFLTALLPVVPTARRAFARTGRLVGFLRIYQGTSRTDPLVPVQLRSSVIDSRGQVVADQGDVLDVGRFEKERTADHYFALPLANLTPGEYLLRTEATMGARVAGRAVRFSVK